MTLSLVYPVFNIVLVVLKLLKKWFISKITVKKSIIGQENQL